MKYNKSNARKATSVFAAAASIGVVAIVGFNATSAHAETTQPTPAAACAYAAASETFGTNPDPLNLTYNQRATLTITNGRPQPGQSCATVTIPDRFRNVSNGTVYMHEDPNDPNSPVTGVMTVNGQTATFQFDPDYVASHPDDLKFGGSMFFEVNESIDEIRNGYSDNINMGNGQTINVNVAACPACADADAHNYKWSIAHISRGVVDSGIILGSNTSTQYAGQSCTISDDIDPNGQSFTFARLVDHNGTTIATSDSAPSITISPVTSGEVYTLQVSTKIADGADTSNLRDTGKIDCNGVSILSQPTLSKTDGTDANGNGSASPTPTPTPTPSETPSAPVTSTTPSSPATTPSAPVTTPTKPVPTTKVVAFRAQIDVTNTKTALEANTLNKIGTVYAYREDVKWNTKTDKVYSAPLWAKGVSSHKIVTLQVTVPVNATPAQILAAEKAAAAKFAGVVNGQVPVAKVGHVTTAAYLIPAGAWDDKTSWKVGPKTAAQVLVGSTTR